MADDFSGKIDVVVDYRGSGGGGTPSSSGGGGGAFGVQNIQAQNFLRSYPKANQQAGVIRALKAQEQLYKAESQRIRKEQTEMAKHFAELEAAEQLKVNTELASIQRRMALQQEYDSKIEAALQKQTNEKLATIQIELANDQKELSAFNLAHRKRMAQIQEQGALERLEAQRQRQQNRGGENNVWKDPNSEANKHLSIIAKSTGFLAATFGIGMMFKSSKVANELLGTISKMLGMMIDLFIMPFMPLILPLMRWLARFVQGFSTFLKDPTGWLKDKTGIGVPEWLNKPLALAGGAAGLAGAGLAGKAIFHPWDTLKDINAALKGIVRFVTTGSFKGTDTAATAAAQAATVTTKPPTKAESQISKFFSDIFGPEARDKYLGKVNKFFGDIFGDGAMNRRLGAVRTFFDTLFDHISISKRLDTIRGFFSKVFAFDAHLTKINDFFRKVFAFDSHLTKIDDFFQSLFGQNKIDEFGRWIKNFFESLPKPTMPDFLKHIFGKPKGDFTWKGLMDFLNPAKVTDKLRNIPGVADDFMQATSVGRGVRNLSTRALKIGGLDFNVDPNKIGVDMVRQLELLSQKGNTVPTNLLAKLIGQGALVATGPAGMAIGASLEAGLIGHKAVASARDRLGPQHFRPIEEHHRAGVQQFLDRVNLQGDEGYWSANDRRREIMRRDMAGLMGRDWMRRQNSGVKIVEDAQSKKIELVLTIDGQEHKFRTLSDAQVRDKFFINRTYQEWDKHQIQISSWEFLTALLGAIP